MRVLTKAQRAGILERLKHNNKYEVLVSYAESFSEKKALEFTSVLQEAGWIVSGPFANENVCPEGIRIGVREPHSPCPSARLLVDTLVAVGINAIVVKAEGSLCPSTFSSCCLQVASSAGADRGGGDLR